MITFRGQNGTWFSLLGQQRPEVLYAVFSQSMMDASICFIFPDITIVPLLMWMNKSTIFKMGVEISLLPQWYDGAGSFFDAEVSGDEVTAQVTWALKRIRAEMPSKTTWKSSLTWRNVNPSSLQIQSISYKLLQAALKSPCCGLHRWYSNYNSPVLSCPIAGSLSLYGDISLALLHLPFSRQHPK